MAYNKPVAAAFQFQVGAKILENSVGVFEVVNPHP
jgi:hypothetical protein